MNIKELAKKSGLTESNNDGIRIETGYWVEELTRFAELVAAHTLMNIDPSKFIGGYQEGFEAGAAKEREECIDFAQRRVLATENNDQKIGYYHACKVIAEGIKARGTR